MTIKLAAAPPGEGIGTVAAIDLPDQLDAGAWITGSLTIRNDGGADSLAVVFKTEWDGRLFGTNFGGATLDPGQTGKATISEGSIKMPSQEAAVTIYGCHQEAGGEFIIGGVPYKVDDTKRH